MISNHFQKDDKDFNTQITTTNVTNVELIQDKNLGLNNKDSDLKNSEVKNNYTKKNKFLDELKEEYLREKNMEIIFEKENKETLREQNNKYIKLREKNAHLFDSDPMIKNTINDLSKKLKYLILFVLVYTFCSSFIFFVLIKLTFFIIQFILILFLLMCLIFLAISIKYGILNDIYSSKAFRLFAVIELILCLIIMLNHILIILYTFFQESYDKIEEYKYTIIFVNLLMFIVLIPLWKFIWSLGKNSFLILIGKKKEYVQLIEALDSNSKKEVIIHKTNQ